MGGIDLQENQNDVKSDTLSLFNSVVNVEEKSNAE